MLQNWCKLSYILIQQKLLFIYFFYRESFLIFPFKLNKWRLYVKPSIYRGVHFTVNSTFWVSRSHLFTQVRPSLRKNCPPPGGGGSQLLTLGIWNFLDLFLTFWFFSRVVTRYFCYRFDNGFFFNKFKRGFF